jgi:ketosteroid isomerase-like protein
MTSDHEDIRNLIAGYGEAVNRRDFDRLADLFTEDARWDVTGWVEFHHQGAGVAPGIRGIVESTSYLVQIHSSPTIRLEQDRAIAHSTLFEFGETLDRTARFEETGQYDDVLVKTPQGWRFASRHFRIAHFRSIPLGPAEA